jgi:hypothetical protein
VLFCRYEEKEAGEVIKKLESINSIEKTLDKDIKSESDIVIKREEVKPTKDVTKDTPPVAAPTGVFEV